MESQIDEVNISKVDSVELNEIRNRNCVGEER